VRISFERDRSWTIFTVGASAESKVRKKLPSTGSTSRKESNIKFKSKEHRREDPTKKGVLSKTRA